MDAKFHDFEWERVRPRSVKRVAVYVFIILTLGGSRLAVELVLLFCPTHSPATGVQLRQCDRPSLFQAINFAFVKRHRGSALGRYFAGNNNVTQLNAY